MRAKKAANTGKGLNLRKLLFRLGAVVILVAIAAVMMVIGRGHTVYIDNKTIEYNGQEYKAYYRVEVSTSMMDKVARLDARDRGMSKWIGQSFKMTLTVTETKDSEPVRKTVSLTLPYGMDNPIINLPALLHGLPREAWLDEFIPAPPTEDDEPLDVGLGDGGIEMDESEEGIEMDAGDVPDLPQ